MRIIAGTARGRGIVAPRGTDTRPTLDRVRESLFSILAGRVAGARVLDLFAGSGALGLEALSRGAAFAVFVDHARAAQAAIRRNIDVLGFTERSRLLCRDWRAALAHIAGDAMPFDLVFLDPPYGFRDAEAALGLLAPLAGRGLVVYEHSRAFSPAGAGWIARDLRRYGDTAVSFLERETAREE